MASVRKREWKAPNGESRTAYVVTYKDQEGVRRTPQFPKKHMADEFRRKVEREMFDGTHTAATATISFKELANKYLADCERRRKISDRMSGATLDLAYRLVETHLVPAFNATKVPDITAKHVRDFVNQKSERYSRVTLVKLIAALRDILQFGMQENVVRRNVVRDQPPRIPIPPKERIEIPSLDDLRRIFETIEAMINSDRQVLPGAFRRQRRDGPLFTAITVYAALTAGLRRGEIAGLRWENVDFEGQRIRVRHSLSRYDGLKGPKSKAGIRDVPLHPILARHLRKLHEVRGEPADGYVLLTMYKTPVAPDEVSRLFWEPVARAVEVRRKDGKLMGLHSLRHAAASLWIKAGVPDLALKKAIGHASIAFTKDVYGHLFSDDEDGQLRMVESVSIVTSRPKLPAAVASST